MVYGISYVEDDEQSPICKDNRPVLNMLKADITVDSRGIQKKLNGRF